MREIRAHLPRFGFVIDFLVCCCWLLLLLLLLAGCSVFVSWSSQQQLEISMNEVEKILQS